MVLRPGTGATHNGRVVYLFALFAILAGVLVYRRVARQQHRSGLLAQRLPEAVREILLAEVPLLRKLPEAHWPALEGKIHLFLDQVTFHGADELEVTDEMRLAIAAQACLLVVNTDHWYDTLRTIIVYPGAFKSRVQRQSGYVVTEREVVRTGESWARGPVILSWAHSEDGAQAPDDGHNVVLHEFAHQLDALSGQADGAPVMSDAAFDEWRQVFVEAFETHQANVAAGRPTMLDAYGATAHEEFLAVAIEVFFEKPALLRADEPGVYAQLVRFFRLDPVTWG
ncbi:MAG: M90 family metallopeptidase [Pseudomonadota bacterium]